jgi:ribose 5-phosphate isomerase B
MKIYIGADHRGYKLKEGIKVWLDRFEFEYQDMGASEFDPRDNYTIFAEKVGSIVANEKNSRGILLCGSGVGVCVVANKFDGVRASLGKTAKQVKAGRHDDDMNVLVIAADYTKKKEATEMVRQFLKTKFSRKPRFRKRLSDIDKIEANN